MLLFSLGKFDILGDVSPFYVPSSLGLRDSVLKRPNAHYEPEHGLMFINTNTSLTEGGIFVGLPPSTDADNISNRARKAILFAVMDSIVMAARLLLIKGVNKRESLVVMCAYVITLKSTT